MMKYKLSSLSFFLVFAISQSSNAEYHNTLTLKGYDIKLSKSYKGSLEVKDASLRKELRCKIIGWDKELSEGAGVISFTSDKIGVLLSSGNKYIRVKDALNCNGHPIPLYSIPFFDDDIADVIDVNFERKLVLALVVIDAQAGTYQAIVSEFNGVRNIFSGKGFWNGVRKSMSDEESSFSVGETVYLGKLSLNGQYVAPNDLDCAFDSFPGVWDIKAKKKIIFPESLGDNEINNRCRKLFDGEATLEALGGKLIRPG